MDKINQELLSFIKSSPTPYHTVCNIVTRLVEDGYVELFEKDVWQIEPAGKYFVRRESSLIAFRIPEYDFDAFNIVATHADSPSFKLTPSFELEGEAYVRLSVNKYGGPVLSSWLDRPLSVAGRLIFSEGAECVTRLVSTPFPVALIPSVAPHMKSSEAPLSLNIDMLPLVCEKGASGSLISFLASLCGGEADSVVSHDLFLINNENGCIWGSNKEYISSPRLDDLQCVFTSLVGFLLSSDEANAPLLAVFDREEVGSASNNGAGSAFLSQTLERISLGLGKSKSEHLARMSASFLISADNAHALHPNRPELSDQNNKGALNAGIAIKHNAMGRYITDGFSAGIIKRLCELSGVPFLNYTNRADITGGSTLGHILQPNLSVRGADIGLLQLSMHSSYETAGARDTEYACELFNTFFSSAISLKENKFTIH